MTPAGWPVSGGDLVKVWELIDQLQRLNLPQADVYARVNGGDDEYGGFVYRVHSENYGRDGDVTLEARP